MRDLACVEWYEKFLNELVRIARSQTTLALQLKLFGTPPFPLGDPFGDG